MEKLSKTLGGHTETLAAVSEKATGEAQSISDLLERHTRMLADLADRFHAREDHLRQTVEKQAEDMSAATDSALSADSTRALRILTSE